MQVKGIGAAPVRGAVARPSMRQSALSGTSSSEDRGRRSDTLAAAHSSPSISHFALRIKKVQLKWP